MNLLQVYILNGESLYLEEGFPEEPNLNDAKYQAFEGLGDQGKDYAKYERDRQQYKVDLQSSIDKALRFENPELVKERLQFEYISDLDCRPEALPDNLCPDGAWEIHDGWRVVKQWQFNNPETDVRIIARLVPVEKQEKVAGFDYKQWNQETESFNEHSLPLASSIVPPFELIVNTTASDKTRTMIFRIKGTEQILVFQATMDGDLVLCPKGETPAYIDTYFEGDKVPDLEVSFDDGLTWI